MITQYGIMGVFGIAWNLRICRQFALTIFENLHRSVLLLYGCLFCGVSRIVFKAHCLRHKQFYRQQHNDLQSCYLVKKNSTLSNLTIASFYFKYNLNSTTIIFPNTRLFFFFFLTLFFCTVKNQNFSQFCINRMQTTTIFQARQM